MYTLFINILQFFIKIYKISYFYLILFIIASFTCGVAKQRTKVETSGLVGGTNAGKGFFPWQVAIYYKNTFMCGGSLIDREHILTAAHCFNGRSKDVREYRIVLGEHNRKYKEGISYTSHYHKFQNIGLRFDQIMLRCLFSSCNKPS